MCPCSPETGGARPRLDRVFASHNESCTLQEYSFSLDPVSSNVYCAVAGNLIVPRSIMAPNNQGNE